MEEPQGKIGRLNYELKRHEYLPENLEHLVCQKSRMTENTRLLEMDKPAGHAGTLTSQRARLGSRWKSTALLLWRDSFIRKCYPCLTNSAKVKFRPSRLCQKCGAGTRVASILWRAKSVMTMSHKEEEHVFTERKDNSPGDKSPGHLVI